MIKTALRLTYDFARNVLLLITEGHSGLFNMVCGGETSRVEVAREVVKLIGKENSVSINEVGSDFFRQEYFAPRPSCERLVNARLNYLGVNIMRDWRSALSEYIEDEFR